MYSKIYIINPKVSIIIPCYNNLKLLKECVESIRVQTFSNYEVWIIDGASNDGTQDYLKSLEHPFRWISEKDKGVYDAMNKGIDLSKGEWLYFLGSDDRIFDKDTLVNVFNSFADSKLDLIIGSIKYDFNSEDSFFLKKNEGEIKPSWSRKMWVKNTLHHQGVFYKRGLYKEHYYTLQYAILADYALNLNLYEKGVQALMINQIIAVCGTDGMSKEHRWKMYQEEIDLKTNQSSVLLKPVFFAISLFKYFIKKRI